MIEYQGADGVDKDGKTIDTAKAFSDWSSDIDDCDGMRYIRFRVTLVSNATTNVVAKIDSVTIPMADLNP